MSELGPPLVGREAQCATVTAALADVESRGVVVAGPSGVGRTRLAREAVAIAEGLGRPTRWAGASPAAAAVPLGALAHLLPPVDGATDALVLLQRAAQAVVTDPSGQRPVLVVDDVHLLDRLSLTLLHQLGAGGQVSLVLTVRTSPATPDPVAALWKDGLVSRVQLDPLSRAHADELAAALLGGAVDSRTGEQLWRLGGGNPLYLRELLEDGRRSGQLRDHDGVWRWEGAMTPSQRLSEIVLNHLGELSAEEWRVLEVLATCEPLPADRLVELSSAGAVTELARRGVLVDLVTGGSGEVRAAHPLLTEVVRRRAPWAALRDVRRQLGEGQPLPTTNAALRRHTALILDRESGEPDGQRLTEAARRANALLDHPLAERLAEAGIAAGGGAAACVALVEATQWQGDPARGDRLAAEALTTTASQEDLSQLTALRSIGLACGLGRTEDAFAVLADARPAVRTTDGTALLTATEAVLEFLSGRPRRAVDLATRAMADAPRRGSARPLAAAAAGAGLAVSGRTDAALATVTEGWAALGEAPAGPQVGLGRLALAQAEVLALRYGGRIDQLERRAAELQRHNLEAPRWAGDAVIALYRGCAALAAGRARQAVRWLVEALAGLDERDPTGVLPLCVAELAIAKVVTGDAAGARRMLESGHGVAHRVPAAFRPTVRSAEAWLAASTGRLTEAGARALDAAAEAAATDQWAVEALLLHTAARFGRGADVVDRITALGCATESGLVAACATHVRAAVDGDGLALTAVSARFEAMGAVLLAADAASDAATAHARAGDRGAAAAARASAAALARRCEVGGETVLHETAVGPLTSREEEVARQAAQGASNQEIADRLVVSVRTVETHLAHVYAKLGISGRRQLADLLG
ncbi:DNA-binding NarL/FixJ family response regulator [Modestobacter versicolor]|uniref:DNA-binding NarL/FixJ family response regulator n=2 Tax=Modestobacter versicolor TaxID=429133 RepID=A0A839XWT3_9ACTN|nr:LuxR family transcriptional regulator [Modestobacter versicolor]MBB3675488.1 DNA-binding NarL/FixJ family response regulator [Modestobacter versicolor]